MQNSRGGAAIEIQQKNKHVYNRMANVTQCRILETITHVK